MWHVSDNVILTKWNWNGDVFALQMSFKHHLSINLTSYVWCVATLFFSSCALLMCWVICWTGLCVSCSNLLVAMEVGRHTVMILTIFLPNLHHQVVFAVCSLAEQGGAAEQGMLDASAQLLDILTEVLALLEPVANSGYWIYSLYLFAFVWFVFHVLLGLFGLVQIYSYLRYFIL